MSEVKREDKIKNEYVRGSTSVALIVHNMEENKLRMFGYVIIRSEKNGSSCKNGFVNLKRKKRKRRLKKSG